MDAPNAPLFGAVNDSAALANDSDDAVAAVASVKVRLPNAGETPTHNAQGELAPVGATHVPDLDGGRRSHRSSRRGGKRASKRGGSRASKRGGKRASKRGGKRSSRRGGSRASRR